MPSSLLHCEHCHRATHRLLLQRNHCAQVEAARACVGDRRTWQGVEASSFHCDGSGAGRFGCRRRRRERGAPRARASKVVGGRLCAHTAMAAFGLACLRRLGACSASQGGSGEALLWPHRAGLRPRPRRRRPMAVSIGPAADGHAAQQLAAGSQCSGRIVHEPDESTSGCDNTMGASAMTSMGSQCVEGYGWEEPPTWARIMRRASERRAAACSSMQLQLRLTPVALRSEDVLNKHIGFWNMLGLLALRHQRPLQGRFQGSLQQF